MVSKNSAHSTGENNMAKGQKRGNREIRKPKKVQKETETAQPATTALTKGVSATSVGNKKK
jgi:hypothetical protein